MDSILEIKKEKNKRDKSKSKEQQDIFRVVISKEANESLEVVVEKIADGFAAGAITKSDIANYLFKNIQKYFQDTDIKNLRAQHFDDKKVLSSIIRGESDLPEELKKAVRMHYGITEKEKKKNPRQAEELSTGMNVDNSKTA